MKPPSSLRRSPALALLLAAGACATPVAPPGAPVAAGPPTSIARAAAPATPAPAVAAPAPPAAWSAPTASPSLAPAPRAPGAGAAPSAPAAAPFTFRFAVGDEVGMVFYEPGVEKMEPREVTARILPDGTITPPLLDPVPAAGRTIKELRDLLTERYTRYIKDPSITVTVRSIYAARAFVLGEVNEPQAVEILGNTSVLQAIAMAGGFVRESADRNTIRVVRGRPGEQPQVLTVAGDAILSGRARSVVLQPGDVVYVHPTGLSQWSRDFNTALQPLATLLSSVAGFFVTRDLILDR